MENLLIHFYTERMKSKMKKVISLVLATMLLVLLASAALAESQGTVMYVRTGDGKSLRVRSSMSTRDTTNVIGSLPYGAKVVTYGHMGGWAMIDYGNRTAYVMYRFLVKYKPEPFDPDTPVPSADTRSFTTVGQLNTLTANMKPVTPYTVVVRPTRASGWVYLRWFPSRAAKEITTYSGYHELTVINELKDWYQVTDPSTGAVGFIYKSYVQ